MVHIELTIVELAVRIVVVRCTAIDQLVKPENVFQLNVVIQLIRQVQLGCVGIELLTV